MVINEFWTKIFFLGYMGVAIIVVFILIMKEQRKEKFNYDERQVLVQNKAYKYAFIFLLFYSAVCCGIDSLRIKWAMPGVILFIGAYLSITIFNVICILENAYEGYNKKIDSKFNSIFFLIAGFLMLVISFDNVININNIITDGLLNENIFPIVLTIFFLSVPAALFARKQIDKKADDQE